MTNHVELLLITGCDRVVSALDSVSSGLGSSPGRGQCVVFLGKTLLSGCLSLFRFSINLLAFYHECCSLIGYATHYLCCDTDSE